MGQEAEQSKMETELFDYIFLASHQTKHCQSNKNEISPVICNLWTTGRPRHWLLQGEAIGAICMHRGAGASRRRESMFY